MSGTDLDCFNGFAARGVPVLSVQCHNIIAAKDSTIPTSSSNVTSPPLIQHPLHIARVPIIE
jgi:hypothetical protein